MNPNRCEIANGIRSIMTNWLIPKQIPIPLVFITPSENQIKFRFSVCIINPMGIPIRQRIKFKIKKLINP